VWFMLVVWYVDAVMVATELGCCVEWSDMQCGVVCGDMLTREDEQADEALCWFDD